MAGIGEVQTCIIHDIVFKGIVDDVKDIKENTAKSVEQIKDHTTKILIGMYGSDDKPGSGFIHEVIKDREYTHGKMKQFEEAINEIKKMVNTTVVTVVTGVLAIAGTVITAIVQGWFK
jgi:predicted DNA-binding ArsR family transcriptional regulator